MGSSRGLKDADLRVKEEFILSIPGMGPLKAAPLKSGLKSSTQYLREEKASDKISGEKNLTLLMTMELQIRIYYIIRKIE